MSRASSGRGFTLTEMLVIIGLMGVAALLSARLFTASMRVIGDAPKAHQQISQFEHMTRAMERDVWNAMSIASDDGKSIRLQQADGSSVEWTFGDEEVTRKESSESSPQRWKLSLPLIARSEGVSLVLQASNPKGSVQRRFVSQMLYLRAI